MYSRLYVCVVLSLLLVRPSEAVTGSSALVLRHAMQNGMEAQKPGELVERGRGHQRVLWPGVDCGLC